MSATIRDVAARAGVSVSTVSRTLNGKDDISPEARRRVLAAVAELHYIPSSVARGLTLGRTKTLGVMITDSASPVFAEILKGVEGIASEAGFGVLLCNSAGSADRERRCLDLLLANRVDGVIYAPVQTNREGVERLEKTGVPFVLVARHFLDMQTDYVVLDNDEAGYLATAHLIALGHRQIGHIAGPAHLSPIQGRLAGYRRALRVNDLPYDDRLVVHAEMSVSGGYAAALHLLEAPARPSAIFATTDLQAAGVLKATRRLGITIPDALALVGGDNMELSELLEVPLTTFDGCARRMGTEAAQLIMARLNGAQGGPRQIVLLPRLVERASSGARPG
jgi:LacI family transcriptional regulator